MQLFDLAYSILSQGKSHIDELLFDWDSICALRSFKQFITRNICTVES